MFLLLFAEPLRLLRLYLNARIFWGVDFGETHSVPFPSRLAKAVYPHHFHKNVISAFDERCDRVAEMICFY